MPALSSVPPFRADHVGSLLRPRALTHGFRQLAAGEITPEDYRALQDAAIREVVALQRAAGLRVATDGEFRRARAISTEEFAFLRNATSGTGLPPRVTLPSPPTMHFWRGAAGLDPAAYHAAAPFFADLARIYRDEIGDLAGLGCTYVQIDEVPLAMLCDPAVRETVRRRCEDPAELVWLYIDT